MIEIKRTYYLDKILKLKDKPFIKVLTGIRRSGKLTILNQYKTILKNEFHISADQIFSYDFNDYEHNSKYNWKTLLEEIIKKSVKNTTNYIFLDEIQEIDKFEKTLISLFESKNINFDIYIAGSNSKMFSTELATLLTGRTYEIFICPITFDELNNCERYTINLRDYLIYGGLGILMPIFDETILKQETLKNVLQDTITKDICVRHKLHYSEDILKIIRFSFKNIGRVISAANIENFLISNKETKITSKTIINYLN
jgi:predicted AAA+ superfamily ATPase